MIWFLCFLCPFKPPSGDKQNLDYWVWPKIATDRAKFDPRTIISLLSVVKFEGKPSLHHMAPALIVWCPLGAWAT